MIAPSHRLTPLSAQAESASLRYVVRTWPAAVPLRSEQSWAASEQSSEQSSRADFEQAAGNDVAEPRGRTPRVERLQRPTRASHE